VLPDAGPLSCFCTLPCPRPDPTTIGQTDSLNPHARHGTRPQTATDGPRIPAGEPAESDV
jgi:hypothetical protein